jgi:TonB family protein
MWRCFISLLAVPALYLSLISFQEKTPTPALASGELPYADKPAGLEKLAKDILEAEKDGDAARVDALVQSMVLPDPRAWYATIFGEWNANRLTDGYVKMAPTLPHNLATSFRDARDNKFTDAMAIRHDQTCDDNAGEFIYPVLSARIQPVPLYELRLYHGDSFKRVWAFAYVSGAFRFVGALGPPTSFGPNGRSTAKTLEGKTSAEEDVERIRIGGTVSAAKIVKRVQPSYPEKARLEHLQGKVVLHVVIARDGSIRNLQVLQGYCSLAEASVAAVKQWKYRPTTLNGSPVEVDTTIDVTFTLNTR